MEIELIKGLFKMKNRLNKRTTILLYGAFMLFSSAGCYVTFESDNSIEYPENLMCESDQVFNDGTLELGPPTDENTDIRTPIPVSTETNRYSRTVCNWVCGECQEDDDTGVRECLSWVENCDAYAREINLYEDDVDLYNITAISSTEDGPYEGCGPTAIYNIAQYFDIEQLTAGEIRDQITTYQLTGGSIGTAPNDLAAGLTKILNKQDEREIIVTQHAGANATDIRYYLSRGYPVIALVQNGDHYVVVTGFVATQDNGYMYRIIDYYGYDRWVLGSYLTLDIDVNLSVFSPMAEFISGSITEWVPGTIFTFSQTTVWP